MAKNISYERQINELKAVPSGIKYLEFVNNPENHISKNEKGDNHHIHMRALGGEYGPVVRLSYYNHIKAHLLYAKAGEEGNYCWEYEAWCAINRMSRCQYKNLTEIEKHFLEEGEHWSELVAIARKKHGQKCKDTWDSKSKEEQDKINKKVSNSLQTRTKEERNKSLEKLHNTLANKPEEEKQASINKRLETIANKPEEERLASNKKRSDTWHNKSEEEKQAVNKKKSNTWHNKPEEEKQASINKRLETIANKPEEERLASNKKRSDSVKETLSNRTPEEWETFRNNCKEAWTPEKCEEHSKLLTKIYEEHPEYHDHVSEGGKRSYIEHPERHQIQSDNSKDMWAREGFRDFMSERIFQYDIEHPERAQKISETMTGKNVDKTYVNNGNDVLFVTQEEAEYLISIGWKPGCFNSNIQKGSWFMTKEGERIYQVIPRRIQEYINNGYYHCMERKNREPWHEKDNSKTRHEKWLESMEKNKEGRIKVVRNHGSKWILPEELDKYILNGWKQKVA